MVRIVIVIKIVKFLLFLDRNSITDTAGPAGKAVAENNPLPMYPSC